ncbi:MAG: hypothetical protein ACHQEM_04730 [Chitinophagales bacterium]
MKELFLNVLLLPFLALAWIFGSPKSSTNLVEVRSGEWPINLERNIERADTSYSLIFRDQQFSRGVLLDTLPFANLEQLKYFGKALTVLKTGTNGDIAKFKDYSVMRADKKYEGIWYILRIKWGLTNFRQPESDLMNKTIKSL